MRRGSTLAHCAGHVPESFARGAPPVDLRHCLGPLTVVALGHWTTIMVDADGGNLAHGVLDRAVRTDPLTWVFPVMPTFLLVGGYSSALSWRSARRKDVSVAPNGCVPPATPRDPAGPVAAGVAGYRGGGHGVFSLVADQPLLGYPNYLLVWAAHHQDGYAWLDGRLSGAGRRLLLAAIGLVDLLLLVLAGPYLVSVITSAANEISNSSPSRITQAILGMLQAGLVLSLEKPLTALLRRPGLWFVTLLVNQRIMTWFLRHLTVMVGLAHLLLALDARVLRPDPLSGVWRATRPRWEPVLLAVTGLMVVAMGRLEEP